MLTNLAPHKYLYIQSEIDTHLNVLHIALSLIYDDASSPSSALSLMLK